MSNVSVPNLYTNGVNFQGLIQSLVSLQAQPINQLTQDLQNLTTDQGLWQTINGQLSALGSAAQTLSTASTFQQTQAVSSNTGVMTATSDSSATSGTYTINATQLAQAEVDVSTQQSSSTAALGYSGSFTINGSAAINVSTSDSLSSIASAINATANTGVTASIINNQLVIMANQTDAPISYVQTSGTPLTSLGVITSTGANNAVQKAQPLLYTINGVQAQSSTNTDATTLAGVTMNFNTTGSTTLTVGLNTSAIDNNVRTFVQAFNTVVQTINTDTAKGGALQGNVGLNTLGSQLALTATNIVPSLQGQAYQSLQDIGITLNQNGTLSLNTSTLNSALASNPSAVAAVFDTASTGIANQFQSISTAYTTANTGIIAAVNQSYANQITQDNQQIAFLQQQLTVYQQQLQQEFLTTQEMIAQMDGTTAYLNQAAGSSSSATGSTGSTSSTPPGG